MSEFLSYRDGNKTNEHGVYRLLSKLLIGEVVNGMAIVQAGTPNMTVVVQPGDCMIPDTNYKYNGWIDADKALTITTADPTNPRLDVVVAYTDKSLVDATNSNSPNGMKFAVVAGTPAATPTAPSAGTIQTAVGASNPYIILAIVRVNAGATSIVTANINDRRSFVALPVQNNAAMKVMQNQVLSGGTLAQVSLLTGSMSNMTYSVNNRQYILNAIDNFAYQASRDTYVDIAEGATVPTYTAVVNGAAAPALAANSVRVGIVFTNATTITSVRQVGFDSLGNMIYRTKRVVLDGRGDGGVAPNAIDYNHTGTLVQFPASSSSFGRFFTVIPEDYESGSAILTRWRHNTVTGTSSTVWNYYIACQAVGQNQTTESWNIASNISTPAAISSSEIIADSVLDIAATKIGRGNIFGIALKPTSNTQSVIVQYVVVEYRPTIL